MLTEETQRLIAQNPQGEGLIRLNRLLLEEAYPREMALSQSLVIDRVAAALALPADVTGALLGRVSHGGETALNVFLALSEIKDTELPVSRANAWAPIRNAREAAEDRDYPSDSQTSCQSVRLAVS